MAVRVIDELHDAMKLKNLHHDRWPPAREDLEMQVAKQKVGQMLSELEPSAKHLKLQINALVLPEIYEAPHNLPIAVKHVQPLLKVTYVRT